MEIIQNIKYRIIY